MGVCVNGWVDQWVGSGQITNNLINLDIIEIILRFMICRDTPTHGWVCGWVNGLMGGVGSNH